MKLDPTKPCDSCGAPYPSHYGRCETVSGDMKVVLQGLDREAAERREAKTKQLAEVADIQAGGRKRMRGKFDALAMDTKLHDFDRSLFHRLSTEMSDNALDALSMAIRN